MNKFLEANYDEIMLMSKKICKSDSEWEDVAHFCIIKFTEHERADELIKLGQAMKFLSGMIHRSFWSNTSQYYTEYHQKGKMIACETIYDDQIVHTEYDYEADFIIEAILGQLEDMKHTDGEGGNRDVKLWEMATQLEEWSKTPNFSEMSRNTKIPRTAIAHSVKCAIEYIKQELKNRGIQYDN